VELRFLPYSIAQTAGAIHRCGAGCIGIILPAFRQVDPQLEKTAESATFRPFRGCSRLGSEPVIGTALLLLLYWLSRTNQSRPGANRRPDDRDS